MYPLTDGYYAQVTPGSSHKEESEVSVEIRKHWVHKKQLVASPQGITIPGSVWDCITQKFEEIEVAALDEDLKTEFRAEFPNGNCTIVVSVKKPFKKADSKTNCVDIRNYYPSEQGIKPTKKGCYLSAAGFLKLKDILHYIKGDRVVFEAFNTKTRGKTC